MSQLALSGLVRRSVISENYCSHGQQQLMMMSVKHYGSFIIVNGSLQCIPSPTCLFSVGLCTTMRVTIAVGLLLFFVLVQWVFYFVYWCSILSFPWLPGLICSRPAMVSERLHCVQCNILSLFLGFLVGFMHDENFINHFQIVQNVGVVIACFNLNCCTLHWISCHCCFRMFIRISLVWKMFLWWRVFVCTGNPTNSFQWNLWLNDQALHHVGRSNLSSRDQESIAPSVDMQSMNMRWMNMR